MKLISVPDVSLGLDQSFLYWTAFKEDKRYVFKSFLNEDHSCVIALLENNQYVLRNNPPPQKKKKKKWAQHLYCTISQNFNFVSTGSTYSLVTTYRGQSFNK